MFITTVKISNNDPHRKRGKSHVVEQRRVTKVDKNYAIILMEEGARKHAEAVKNKLEAYRRSYSWAHAAFKKVRESRRAERAKRRVDEMLEKSLKAAESRAEERRSDLEKGGMSETGRKLPTPEKRAGLPGGFSESYDYQGGRLTMRRLSFPGYYRSLNEIGYVGDKRRDFYRIRTGEGAEAFSAKWGLSQKERNKLKHALNGNIASKIQEIASCFSLLQKVDVLYRDSKTEHLRVVLTPVSVPPQGVIESNYVFPGRDGKYYSTASSEEPMAVSVRVLQWREMDMDPAVPYGGSLPAEISEEEFLRFCGYTKMGDFLTGFVSLGHLDLRSKVEYPGKSVHDDHIEDRFYGTVKRLILKQSEFRPPITDRPYSSSLRYLLEDQTGEAKKAYERSRHDRFQNAYLAFFRMKETKGDVSPTSRYGYYGVDCNKTPDMFVDRFESKPVTYIVDFKVTGRRSHQALDNEMQLKYGPLATGLSEFLKREVKIVTVVLVLADRMVRRMPWHKSMRLTESEVELCNDYEKVVEAVRGYQDLKDESDSDMGFTREIIDFLLETETRSTQGVRTCFGQMTSDEFRALVEEEISEVSWGSVEASVAARRATVFTSQEKTTVDISKIQGDIPRGDPASLQKIPFVGSGSKTVQNKQAGQVKWEKGASEKKSEFIRPVEEDLSYLISSSRQISVEDIASNHKFLEDLAFSLENSRKRVGMDGVDFMKSSEYRNSSDKKELLKKFRVRGEVRYDYEGYSILLESGSFPTEHKGVRVKVQMSKDRVRFHGDRQTIEVQGTSFVTYTHSFMLTLGYLDQAMRAETVYLLSREKMGDDIAKFVYAACIFNRNESSTLFQDIRYIIMNCLSLQGDRKGLFKKHFSTKVRSKIGSAALFFGQMVANELQDKSNDLTALSLSSSYDSSLKFDFEIIINGMKFNRDSCLQLMYLGNLMNKTDQDKKSKLSSMMEKQMECEAIFRDHNENMRGNSLEECLDSPDKFKFNSNIIYTASANWAKRNTRGGLENLAHSLFFDTSVDLYKTTSSVKQQEKLEKTSLFQNLDDFSSANGFIMINLFKEAKGDFLFSLFPKDQIGKAREILIQGLHARLRIWMIERLGRSFCSMDEREMLTNPNKEIIQTATMSSFREELQNPPPGYVSVAIYENRDATRWSPAMNLFQYIPMLKGLGLGEILTTVSCHVVLENSYKKVLLSDDLIQLMGSFFEADDPIQHRVNSLLGDNKKRQKSYGRSLGEKERAIYRQALEDGYLTLLAGMGQGVLHYLSSLYHVILEEASDLVTKEKESKHKDFKVRKRVVQLSSDDKTRYSIYDLKKPFHIGFYRVEHEYRFEDLIAGCFNIFTNTKKSGASFIVSEFNSLFCFGRTPSWAWIKDAYSLGSTGDLSIPYQAALDKIGELRRLLEHGCSIRELEVVVNHLNERNSRRLGSLMKNMITGFIPEEWPMIAYQGSIMEYRTEPEVSGFMGAYNPDETVYNRDNRIENSTWTFKSKFAKFEEEFEAKVGSKTEGDNVLASILSRSSGDGLKIRRKNYYLGVKSYESFNYAMTIHSLLRASGRKFKVIRNRSEVFTGTLDECADFVKKLNLEPPRRSDYQESFVEDYRKVTDPKATFEPLNKEERIYRMDFTPSGLRKSGNIRDIVRSVVGSDEPSWRSLNLLKESFPGRNPLDVLREISATGSIMLSEAEKIDKSWKGRRRIVCNVRHTKGSFSTGEENFFEYIRCVIQKGFRAKVTTEREMPSTRIWMSSLWKGSLDIKAQNKVFIDMSEMNQELFLTLLSTSSRFHNETRGVSFVRHKGLSILYSGFSACSWSENKKAKVTSNWKEIGRDLKAAILQEVMSGAITDFERPLGFYVEDTIPFLPNSHAISYRASADPNEARFVIDLNYDIGKYVPVYQVTANTVFANEYTTSDSEYSWGTLPNFMKGIHNSLLGCKPKTVALTKQQKAEWAEEGYGEFTDDYGHLLQFFRDHHAIDGEEEYDDEDEYDEQLDESHSELTPHAILNLVGRARVREITGLKRIEKVSFRSFAYDRLSRSMAAERIDRTELRKYRDAHDIPEELEGLLLIFAIMNTICANFEMKPSVNLMALVSEVYSLSIPEKVAIEGIPSFDSPFIKKALASRSGGSKTNNLDEGILRILGLGSIEKFEGLKKVFSGRMSEIKASIEVTSERIAEIQSEISDVFKLMIRKYRKVFKLRRTEAKELSRFIENVAYEDEGERLKINKRMEEKRLEDSKKELEEAEKEEEDERKYEEGIEYVARGVAIQMPNARTFEANAETIEQQESAQYYQAREFYEKFYEEYNPSGQGLKCGLRCLARLRLQADIISEVISPDYSRRRELLIMNEVEEMASHMKDPTNIKVETLLAIARKLELNVQVLDETTERLIVGEENSEWFGGAIVASGSHYTLRYRGRKKLYKRLVFERKIDDSERSSAYYVNSFLEKFSSGQGYYNDQAEGLQEICKSCEGEEHYTSKCGLNPVNLALENLLDLWGRADPYENRKTIGLILAANKTMKYWSAEENSTLELMCSKCNFKHFEVDEETGDFSQEICPINVSLVKTTEFGKNAYDLAEQVKSGQEMLDDLQKKRLDLKSKTIAFWNRKARLEKEEELGKIKSEIIKSQDTLAKLKENELLVETETTIVEGDSGAYYLEAETERDEFHPVCFALAAERAVEGDYCPVLRHPEFETRRVDGAVRRIALKYGPPRRIRKRLDGDPSITQVSRVMGLDRSVFAAIRGLVAGVNGVNKKNDSSVSVNSFGRSGDIIK